MVGDIGDNHTLETSYIIYKNSIFALMYINSSYYYLLSYNITKRESSRKTMDLDGKMDYFFDRLDTPRDINCRVNSTLLDCTESNIGRIAHSEKILYLEGSVLKKKKDFQLFPKVICDTYRIIMPILYELCKVDGAQFYYLHVLIISLLLL